MNPSIKSNSIKRTLLRVVQWAVVALCLAYVFWDFEVDLFVAAVSQYNVLAVLFATALTFGGVLALSGRLSCLSEGAITYKNSLTGTFIGQGVNNLLPAKLGEVVKAVYLAKASKKSNAWLMGLVFWERFFDLNVLLILGILISLSVSSQFSVGSFAVIVGGIWLVLVAVRKWPNFMRAIVEKFPVEVLRKFFLELIEHLIRRLELRVVLKASIWTVILFAQYIGQVAVILLLAAQFDLSLAAVLVIFVVSGIGMNLGVSPGGLGVYEAAIVLSASWFGVGREEALASAIVLHVIQYLPTTVMGLFMMSRVNMSIHSGKVNFKND